MGRHMHHKVEIGLFVAVAALASTGGPSSATAGSCGSHNHYDVAAYVWPAYQSEPRWAELGIFADGKGEWQNVWEAVPKWEGHRQPLVPLWGYENEADPKVVEKKIDAAVSHGVWRRLASTPPHATAGSTAPTGGSATGRSLS